MSEGINKEIQCKALKIDEKDEFSLKICIPSNRVERIINDFSSKSLEVKRMIDHSFLETNIK